MKALGSNGEWGFICDNGFDLNDANVICKMLGHPYATAALVNGTANELYGTASSGKKFILNNLGCSGNEGSIFDCPHDGEWNAKCKKKNISGVQCATSKL